MPGRPCTREAGAPTEPASAPVDGHGHQFRRGVDQPGYVRLLRCFASFDRDGLHPSVTQRATSYGFHLQWVSIKPGAEAADAHNAPTRGSLGGGTVPKAVTSSAPIPRMLGTVSSAARPRTSGVIRSPSDLSTLEGIERPGGVSADE